jgi:putative ABC transport system permease protein
MIAMFYNMCFLAVAKDIGSVSDSESLRYILFLGTVVIGIFSCIFLFYTNSFLIKRRKKEFGLFNVLGMEKKHIARIMFYETLYIGGLSILAGLAAGILLSKLMILLLFKLISFDATFGFEIPKIALLSTLVLFTVIFLVNLVYNMGQVHLSKPVELLRGGSAGEKEPKAKWIMAVFGAVCLGAGYYIAVTTENPLSALNMFFVAVLLVIVGTYCLFISGSIALLKVLRKNKRYYYKPRHFISVSGMIYRMKQNAAGLSNICILSTAVIVMVSTTVSLYIGMEDVLRTQFVKNIEVSASDVSEEQAGELDKLIEQQISEHNTDKSSTLRIRSMDMVAIQEGLQFIKLEQGSDYNKLVTLVFITQDEYNKLEGTSISLKEGEAMAYVANGDIPGSILDINGYELSVKEYLSSFSYADMNLNFADNYYYIVVDNITTINKAYVSLTGDENVTELSYYYGFDTYADSQEQIDMVNDLNVKIWELDVFGRARGAEASRSSFYSLYGGLFFLGIFLGILFVMATVLIIYYKQIVEGYDDKERFEIMQKVGMSREEIKGTIRSQVLTVFFLPLLTSVIHIVFAFKVITKLLLLFGMNNVRLFAACTAVTIIVFAIFYTIIYSLTARTYYKIVS